MISSIVLSKILIAPQVITDEGIKYILDYAQDQPTVDLSIFDPKLSNDSGKAEFVVNKNIRDTQLIEIDDIRDQIIDLYKDIVFNIINPYYGFEINDSETPQLLHYGQGGHYKPHHDGVAPWKAPDGTTLWRKSANRDLSTVIFLNDDFQGGDFVFPELKIKITPEPGLMICFPSNQMYLHGVEPVLEGNRYSLVNWMTVKGFQTQEQETKMIQEQYGVS